MGQFSELNVSTLPPLSSNGGRKRKNVVGKRPSKKEYGITVEGLGSKKSGAKPFREQCKGLSPKSTRCSIYV